MRYKSKIGIAVGAAITVLALAGCSSTPTTGGASWSLPSKDPKATITLESTRTQAELSPMIAAFEKAHPSITVKLIYTPNDSYDSVLQTQFTSKSGTPDVFWANMPEVPAFASRGYLEDLSSVFDKYTKPFVSSAISSVTFDKKLYALPLAESTQLLYYNKDLLAKASVAAPSADPAHPSTWESVQKGALAAVAAGASNGLIFEQPNTYYQLEPLSTQKGGGPGATGKGNLTPNVNNSGWVAAMKWYGGLFSSGASPKGLTISQTVNTFTGGKAAYLVGGPWNLQAISQTNLNWGIAAQPTFEGAKAATPTGSWAVSMNAFSKNKAAAAVLIKWMTIDNGGGYPLYFTGAEQPANTKAYSAYYSRSGWQSPAGKLAAKISNYQLANNSVNRLNSVGFIQFNNALATTYSDIANGTDPKTALDAANAAIVKAWIPYTK
jgi:ABC-type glycerol-3-phosphate transport system substrate-binding protein